MIINPCISIVRGTFEALLSPQMGQTLINQHTLSQHTKIFIIRNHNKKDLGNVTFFLLKEFFMSTKSGVYMFSFFINMNIFIGGVYAALFIVL